MLEVIYYIVMPFAWTFILIADFILINRQAEPIWFMVIAPTLILAIQSWIKLMTVVKIVSEEDLKKLEEELKKLEKETNDKEREDK